MLKLEDCEKHKALRYLTFVEGKKKITPVVYEVRQGSGKRSRYQKRRSLTAISRSELICPEDRERERGTLDHYRKTVLEHTTQELALLKEIEKREKRLTPERNERGIFVPKTTSAC